MTSVLHHIYCQPLEKVVVIMFISILLWCILARLCLGKSLSAVWKAFNTCVFITGCIVIVYSTIIVRSSGVSEVYLTPFYSYIEAQSNVEMYRTNLMNVFLFLPFGLSLPVILPASFKKKVLFTVLAAAGISISVELIQFVFELGRVETDDVIHNTLGAALGALPVVLARIKSKFKY